MSKNTAFSTDTRAEIFAGTYMGVDAGVGGTGVVVISAHPPQYQVVHRTTLGFSVADAGGISFGRVPLIRNAICHLLQEYHPTLVVQEDYLRNLGAKNMNFPFQIGELGGALKCLYHDRRQPYMLWNNSRLRSLADVEKGTKTKEGVINFVRERYGIVGLRLKDHDQADAFVLALAGFIAHRLVVEDWRGVLGWFSERKINLFASSRKTKGKYTGALQRVETFVGMDSLPDFDETKLRRLQAVLRPGGANEKKRQEENS